MSSAKDADIMLLPGDRNSFMKSEFAWKECITICHIMQSNYVSVHD